MFSALPGAIDIYQTVWYTWIVGQTLANIGVQSNIFHTLYVFYPAGIPTVTVVTMYTPLLALIITPILGIALTYNILYLMAFVLSGYGAYLLARHITRNDAASVVAGIVYAFAPYHFAHAYAGHTGSVTMQWIPFCALFIIRMFEKKDLKDAVAAAFFFILVAMSDLQYMVFMGLFIILYIIYALLSGTIKLEKKTVTLVVVFGIISLIGVLPFTYSTISVALSKSNYLSPDVNETKFFSADLLSFFVPAYFHPIFGQLATTLFYDKSPLGQVTPWETTTYAGICVLVLSIYALLKNRSKDLLFWALSTVFFALMSLGPVLHIAGRSTFFGTNMEIPMPFSLVSMIVPTLSDSRTPGRFDVMVVLSLSVLVAYAISVISEKLKPVKFGIINVRNIVLIIITLAILFEYLAIPFTMTDSSVPSFYYSLKNETGKFGIMEIPASLNYTAGVQAEYYQTVHQKYMVGGQVARTPLDAADFELNTPLVNQLTNMVPSNDIFEQNITEIGNFLLNHYNIRYVILQRNYMTSQQLGFTETLLNNTLRSVPIYDSDNITVYMVNQSMPKMFMEAGSGWYSAETWGNETWRWMDNASTTFVYLPDGGNRTLTFDARSFYSPRTMHVWVNNEWIANMTIGTDQDHVALPIMLHAGDNTIRIESLEGSQRPSDIPGLNNADKRSISFIIGNVSID